VVLAPDKITTAKMARCVRQVLGKWKGKPSACASWEDFDDFCARFPTF
jgi:hypothetical protein